MEQETMSHVRYFKLMMTSLAMSCVAVSGSAQQHVNALFIGNSYTEVNNLPQMVQQIAFSMGDQLSYQSNTPGGCTFSQHCNNHSMELICDGGWDFVVLQEQSQYPSFPQGQVENEVFPFAERLVDSVYAHNPCCEPMFYMTWGRKNGDAGNAPYFPVLGTYEGMDSMLCERYTYMAHEYDASLCPVGRVWRFLRENHRDIELYQADESHPSMAGTYAAACAFYVMFFHRDPDSISFGASLPATTTQIIRSAVRHIVYEQLEQWQRPKPQASFEVEVLDDGLTVLTSSSLHADSLRWYFGDGNDTLTSAERMVMEHVYGASGLYTATLVASRHCMTDTFSMEFPIVVDSTEGMRQVGAGEVSVYPNPVCDWLNIVLPAPAGHTTVTLVDMYGRIVSSCDVDGSVFRLKVVELPAGEYLLHIKRPSGVSVRRIMVYPL